MHTTQVLRNEHRVIERVLDCLDILCDEAMSFHRLNGSDGYKIIDFLSDFANKCHNVKEAQILYPAIRKKGVVGVYASRTVQSAENASEQLLLGQMREAIPHAERGQGAALAVFVDAASRYEDLVRTHIQNENRLVFPVADNLLNEQEQLEIAEQCERFDECGAGDSKLEYYLGLANDLADRYGVPRAEFEIGDRELQMAPQFA